MGSTRLSGKVLLPFFNQHSILEIILKKISKEFPSIPLIVATTTSKADTPIIDLCTKLSINYYRGNETNVLSRFIEAAEAFEINQIIRICADNPFLDLSFLKTLLSEQRNEDYLSFRFPDNTPVIKSHIGVFAEATQLRSLKKVANLTNDNYYHEHVTNFLYEHPEHFSLRWLELPLFLKDRKDLRFTVDTKEDFETQQQLFNHFFNKNLDLVRFEEVVAYVSDHLDILEKMNRQIKYNSK